MRPSSRIASVGSNGDRSSTAKPVNTIVDGAVHVKPLSNERLNAMRSKDSTGVSGNHWNAAINSPDANEATVETPARGNV